MKNILYRFFRKQNSEFLEWQRLKEIPRYTPTSTNLLGAKLQMVDACTFLGGYEEIFKHEIYQFLSKSPTPTIIDCGANIGLSVLYFKKLFPHSNIIAFEADPNIFSVLKENIKSFKMDDVTIHNKAIWVKNGEIKFSLEGGFSGRIAQHSENNQVIIESVRLNDYLAEEIDFLKLDIEGAENSVIFDCSSNLKNIKNLFLEYLSHENDEQKLGDILKLLTENKFRYHIKEAYTMEKPFVQRDTMLGMDLQLNIFAYKLE